MTEDRFWKRKKGFQFNLEEVLTKDRRERDAMDEPPEDPYFRNPGAIIGLFLMVVSVVLLMLSPIGHLGWKAFAQWVQSF